MEHTRGQEAGGVRLVSRNGPDHTKFRAIAEALAALRPKTFTLDGEVAVFDAELVSRFEWLRHLSHGDLATPPLLNGFAAWAEALHRGYEGMMPKDPESPYIVGRTLKWLKVKQPKYREEEGGSTSPSVYDSASRGRSGRVLLRSSHSGGRSSSPVVSHDSGEDRLETDRAKRIRSFLVHPVTLWLKKRRSQMPRGVTRE